MSRAGIPRCADLASDALMHRFDDMFNPPGLTNFLGAAQVDHDVVAVRSLNFAPVSLGDTITGTLFVDGRLFRSFGEPVTVTWRPDRVVREARVGDLELTTVTACPPGVPGVVVDVQVRNRGGSRRAVRLGLRLDSTVTNAGGPWRSSSPPSEANDRQLDRELPAVTSRARTSAALSMQGVDVPAAVLRPDLVEVELDLAAGEARRFGYVHVVGDDESVVRDLYRRVVADVPGAVRAAEREWDAELEAMFTPGNDRFSGSLPVLLTDDDALRKVYWTGAMGVAWFKRDTPASVLGRVYDTLMPRYWQTTTFIWDYMLSSLVHALLDPVPMRRQLEHWVSLDIHTHFGTEWQTGAPAGYWYAVNDYAMTRLVRDYVRFTGDSAFLSEKLETPSGVRQPVADHLVGWVRAWQGLRGRHGLADYGEMDNLLECVSTYTHEVASFNATNVWALRAAAELLSCEGASDVPETLRREARDLAAKVRELYVDGTGHWLAGQPDGSRVPVRHCLDFANVGMAMADDLSERQRTEMVDYFVRELQTPNWMRALSPWDPDAAFSLRPDHQWNGAYPAWPPDAATALCRLGRPDLALEWLPGLARSANQGPFGQAHFVEEAVPGVNGGARKSPPQFPYLIDWACSSSGAWVSLVIESVFGVQVPCSGEPTARPEVGRVDRDALLDGLVVRGTSYRVTATGIERTSAGA